MNYMALPVYGTLSVFLLGAAAVVGISFAEKYEEKLYMVIRHNGEVGGIAGPLPYKIDECIIRRDEMRNAQAQALETGRGEKDRLLTDIDKSEISALTFDCEFHSERPVISYKGK